MTETPHFPSREHSVHRYAAEAVEALDYIEALGVMLDGLAKSIRQGNTAGFEVDTIVSTVARLSASVRALATWNAHERGRCAQEYADVNGFMAEFAALLADGSLGTYNARALASMTPREVVEALLTRVGTRPRDTEGWTMQPFYNAAAARVAELRPEAAEKTDGDDNEKAAS